MRSAPAHRGAPDRRGRSGERPPARRAAARSASSTCARPRRRAPEAARGGRGGRRSPRRRSRPGSRSRRRRRRPSRARRRPPARRGRARRSPRHTRRPSARRRRAPRARARPRGRPRAACGPTGSRRRRGRDAGPRLPSYAGSGGRKARVRTIEELPRGVREVEHCWIPLSDGVRLAARLWIPAEADAEPVPAILEYLPYGKREGTRERDEPMHRYFAGHGYAAVRVDLRGTGDSEGLLFDEYLEQELVDGCEVIAWIASQPWCDGEVGMIGKSWGGFNALQIAALRPPALRGVISACASDDRYADDAHYKGGCLLVENFRWGAALFALVAHPPDPLIAGDAWRERWLERLEHAVPFAARWLRHPLRDAYWRHGSVCEDPRRIACPVYAIGGWVDGYTNSVPRLVAALPGRCQGLIGPWGHLYPHEGRPGPAIGFLAEALRFFSGCLEGAGGNPGEPRLRAWMQESAMPGEVHWERKGRWVGEESWPSPNVLPRRLCLAGVGLRSEHGREVVLHLAPDASVGRRTGP